MRDPNTHGKSTTHPPPIPPPRSPTAWNHTPHQNICPPTANFNPPQLLNTSHASNHFPTSKGSMPLPRPPPLPPKLQNSSAPAPPPPLPPSLSSLPVDPFKLKENPSVPSASSSDTNRTSFLDGICGFNKEKLKVCIPNLVHFLIEFFFQSVPQQAPPPIKSPENSGKPDTRNTLEENIRILLDSRRMNISKKNFIEISLRIFFCFSVGGDKHEESDSNDDDWEE